MAKKTLPELRAEAEALSARWNDEYQSEKFAESIKTREELDNVVGDYLNTARNECFAACAKADNPMIAAVTLLTFDAIKVKEDKPKPDGPKFPTLSITECTKPIDLIRFDAYCRKNGHPKGIGVADDWIYVSQKFNMLMTASAVLDLREPDDSRKPADILKSVNDSMAMHSIAREIDLGECPTSNTAKTKLMAKVIAAMIGEGDNSDGKKSYKVVTPDIKFFEKAFTRKSKKALTVTTANHKQVVDILANICHKLVCGKVYDADFKKIK